MSNARYLENSDKVEKASSSTCPFFTYLRPENEGSNAVEKKRVKSIKIKSTARQRNKAGES